MTSRLRRPFATGIGRTFSATRLFARATALTFLTWLAKRVVARRHLVVVLTHKADGLTMGGGSQLHARVSTVAFSRAIGVGFANTRMSQVDHGGGKEWTERWNRLIDLDCISSPVPRSVSFLDVTVMGAFKSVLAGTRKQNLYLNLTNPHWFSDAKPRYLDELRPVLRNLYKTEDSGGPATTPRIGVHLRLLQPADVQFTSNRISNFPKIVERLGLRDMRYGEVVIFASPNANLDFLRTTYDFEIDVSDVFSTFHRMVASQELVVGHSSLSYLAGMLSNGRVWYSPFWHPRLSTWHKL